MSEADRAWLECFLKSVKETAQQVKLGTVRETTGRQRHRLFTYHHYLEILNRGTELPKASR